MLQTALMRPNIADWPKEMRRLWTEAEIMEMPRERTAKLRAQNKATGEPVHFFTDERCERCDHVAPRLLSSGQCVVCVHRKNKNDRKNQAYASELPAGGKESTQLWHAKTKTLNLGRTNMPGGGKGNRMLRPDSTWAIFRPDDAKRNKEIRLVTAAKRKRGINSVTAHMAHSGWPLAPGVYVIGLETHEDLVPVHYSVNRKQGNRLHDPADPTNVAKRVFSLDEQHELFVKTRRAIFAWDIVWADGLIGSTAVGVRKERYAFGPDGIVAYTGNIAAEAAAWDRAMVQLDLEAYAEAGGDIKAAARVRGISATVMRDRLVEAGLGC